ncbi:MAG: prepilin-type N-terminal cleavage/methylation domain-containing protein [Bdellovibrionota bacterium]
MRSSKAGFTLLEVLAATMIFSLCVFAIIDSQRTSQRTIVQSERLFQATNLAHLKMTELELKYQRELNVDGATSLIKEEAGAFEAPYDSFKWKSSVKKAEVDLTPAAMEKFMTGLGLDKDAASEEIEKQKLVLTNLNKMIKENFFEVRLEISWKDGKRDSILPIVTHIIPDKPKIEITTTAEE